MEIAYGHVAYTKWIPWTKRVIGRALQNYMIL